MANKEQVQGPSRVNSNYEPSQAEIERAERAQAIIDGRVARLEAETARIQAQLDAKQP